MEDRFTANYGIGRLNPEDTPTYDREETRSLEARTPASRDGQQAAD